MVWPLRLTYIPMEGLSLVGRRSIFLLRGCDWSDIAADVVTQGGVVRAQRGDVAVHHALQQLVSLSQHGGCARVALGQGRGGACHWSSFRG
jgi:hypothetical protein